jgi:hypothetical protein
MLLDQLLPGNHSRIALAAGLSTEHTSRVLRGVRGCSLRVAVRIAAAAGVSLDQLWNHIAASPEYKDRGRRITAEGATGRGSGYDPVRHASIRAYPSAAKIRHAAI